MEGPGPDGSMAHEQAEGEPADPSEQPAPGPDIAALIERQSELMHSLSQAFSRMSRPRVRVPVRDADGNITHVIEHDVEEEPQQSAQMPEEGEI